MEPPRPAPAHDPARDRGEAPAVPESWTVLSMIRWSTAYLEGKGVERARLDAEHLLAHALRLRRLDLYLQYDRPLEPHERDAYRPLLKRRAAREPLQYILGRQPFRELDLLVDRRVLIPRPETEVLVDVVLARVRGPDARPAERGGAGPAGPEAEEPRLEALDVGTGSGAIALSLAFEGPFARVVATDAAADALEVARANRAAAGLEARVELREGADWEPLGANERFDVIVSNPPYVAERERETLEPEVAAWEPPTALFGGPDGLDVVRRLVEGAPARLRAGGLLALEVGATQAREVACMLKSTGCWEQVTVERDLAGRDRIVTATLAHERRDSAEEG